MIRSGSGAPFLNPLLAILTIVGAIVLTHEKPSGYEIIVLSWMLVTGVGTFFAVTLQTEIWRIWYLQPLWLVAAAGMSGLLKVADSAADLAKSNAENVMVAGLILLGGLTVLILQPILGSWIFYVVTALPAVFNFRRCKTSTILATSLILFVSLFFVNHALRSLFPLFLDPHNFREH